MIVFGDLEAEVAPRETLPLLAERWRAAAALPAGETRTDALAGVYVETARVAQGCVDAEFAGAGEDALTPLHATAIATLGALAAELDGAGDDGSAAIAALAAQAPAERLRTRIPEGFAFYGLDPLACLRSAAPPAAVVIGLRSIGLALAPLLARRLGARLVVTLRPTGHPFARVCRVSPELRARLAACAHLRFAIVDEGPGLSGSSFGAAADLLEELGVERARIAFHPSHGGDLGPQASDAHRARWRAASRHVLETPRLDERPPAWLDATETPRDMSGGLWREIARRDAPANRPFERRKALARTAQGAWLARFDGLGDLGAHKARLAARLAEAGFAPAARAGRGGYGLTRWIEEARDVAQAPREALIARIGDYLAFRRTLQAPDLVRADCAALMDMARFNATQALGEESAGAFARFRPRLGALARAERIVATDNKMQAWEWLLAPDGRILKCDGTDHHAGHDLIGCRDVAWDVAGAALAFDMTEAEIDRLGARAGTDPTLTAFFLPVQCAFQLGAAAMAADANAAWPEDAEAWRREQARLTTRLRGLLEAGA
ncbi:MAG TPA: hypothetical protein VIL72_08280 [Beijerinckiaceae bacterium]|jgi:hypothetical protein